MSTCVDALVAAVEFSICAFVRVLAIALDSKFEKAMMMSERKERDDLDDAS